jgi:hypothetical protein
MKAKKNLIFGITAVLAVFGGIASASGAKLRNPDAAGTPASDAEVCSWTQEVQFKDSALGDHSYCLRESMPTREVKDSTAWATAPTGVCLGEPSSTIAPCTSTTPSTLRKSDILTVDSALHVTLRHSGETNSYAEGDAKADPSNGAWLRFENSKPAAGKLASTFYVYFADIPPFSQQISKWYFVEEFAADAPKACKMLAPDFADGTGSTNYKLWDSSKSCGAIRKSTPLGDLKHMLQIRILQTGVSDGHETHK